jgi:hypothetical protein
MKSQASSTGRRWNIIPTLSRSRSFGSQSPSRSRSKTQSYRSEAFPSDEIGSTASSSHEASRESAYALDDHPERQLDAPSQASSPMSHRSEAKEDIAQFSISGITEDDGGLPRIAAPISTAFLTSPSGMDFLDEGDTVDFGSTLDPSRYTPEEPIPFNLSQAEDDFLPKPSGTFAQFTPEKNNDGFSDSRAQFPSNPNSSPSNKASTSFDPFTPQKESRKPTTKYTLEPKDYSKVTSYSSQARDTSTSFSQSSRSTAAKEIDYRRTKAYSQYDDQFSASALEPPGVNMEFYAKYSSSQSTPKPNYSPGTEVHKPSPTSVADLSNANVRWSENLDQLPTPRREAADRKPKPKSILRNVRNRSENDSTECPTDETTPRSEKAVRISNKPAEKGQFVPDSPSAMGFVDGGHGSTMGFVDSHGRALSPIPSHSQDELSMSQGDERKELPRWMDHTPSFEKNIPEEFQRAFLTENAVRSFSPSCLRRRNWSTLTFWIFCR